MGVVKFCPVTDAAGSGVVVLGWFPWVSAGVLQGSDRRRAPLASFTPTNRRLRLSKRRHLSAHRAQYRDWYGSRAVPVDNNSAYGAAHRHTGRVVEDARQGIQSVELAMRVLAGLEKARGPASLSEVASLAGLYPSKVHRYLVSLARSGFVEQEPSGRYTLGPAARRLGVEALRRGDEVSIATKYAVALRDTTQHTTNVATWSDAGPVIIRWDYGAYPLPITVRVGSTLPLADSSVGLVYLAHLPPALSRPVLRGQQKRGETSSVSWDAIEPALTQVRRDGYAATAGGVIPGLAALAAPVLGPGLGVTLVVSIVLPSNALTASVRSDLVTHLLQTTAAITGDLGFELAE
jgi:DNA-binding IclR family transcriptional regulator